MEVDDTSRNSRSNRKKRSSRRSSILKINMSPVRTALGDIDPNQVQEGTREAKSKRLSKRVSFADTLSVREFLNDNDAHTLGVWNSPHDQKNNEQQAESEVGDDEVVIGPTIQGLDSLLSAPIKDQTEQNTLPASMVLQEDRADCQPKELTMTMDFTQTHGAILTELEAHQATQRSRSSSSESDASIQHDIDEPNPTFIGPSYSCLMPASFNSNTATEPGDSVPRADGMEQTRIFQNDDTTGFMDLTNCYGGLMNSSTSRQTSQKTDTSLFIQSLTKPTQQKSKTNDFLRSLMAPKAGKSNLQSGHSPQMDTSVASFTKESSVLESINTENGLCGNLESKSYVDVNQLIQYRTNMEVGIPSTGIDKENQDHSRLLSAKRSGALELTESAINFTTDEKTQVFANDDQADMDMTECVLSNTPTSPYIPQVGTEERHTLPEDQTRMFNTKDAGMMEITECVGNVVQASFSHDLKQKKIADQTVMFTDGGDAEMDETTPLGQIELSSSSAVAWNQNYKPSFRNKSLSIIQEAEDENISRRNSSVINCTSTSDHKEDLDGTTHRAFVNDFTIGMDFTANGQIIRPKYTSTPFQQTLPKSLCTKDAADDKTSTVDITMCGQFNVTKSENVLGKEISTSSRGEMKHESKSMEESKGQALEMPRNVGEETVEIERTTFVGGLMQQRHGTTPGGFEKKMSASEITTVFGSGEQTGNMELTSCVGGLLQQASQTVQSNVPAAEMTRDFDIGEDTGRMELTSCIGGLGPTNQQKTPMSVGNKIPAVEVTRVFDMGEDTGRMELTSCVGGLVPTNQVKIPMSNRSKAPDVETTTVFGMGEDTGRIELTSCVGGIVPPKQGKTPMSCRSETPAVEATRVFGNGDGTGRMELTSCVGSLLRTNQGKPPMSDRSKAPAVETTTVFGMGEDTGRMELTSCVGGFVATNQGKTPMSDRSKAPAAEMTRVFGIGEDTGKMELTSCFEGLVPTNQGKTSMSDRSKAPAADMTRMFGMGENTGRVELKSCVGGLVSTNRGKTPMSDRSKTPDVESTRVFGNGEDTGRMELTSCAGGLAPPKQGKTPMSCRSKTPAVEMTRVFGIGEDTGRMELTSCVGGLLRTNQGKTPMSDRNKAPAVEMTTVFGMGEDTGRMELTSCVGGFVPTNQGKTPMSEKSKATAADMTRIFGMGENTGGMELTSCVRGLVPTNRGKTPISDKSKTPDVEATRVFGNGEDTGRMELTSCVGGLVPPKQGKTPMSCRSETPAVETTRVFGLGEDTGRMELPSCVGGLLRTNQGKIPMSDRNKAPAVETTTVFGMGEDTGRMELTSCVGGFVPTNQGKTPMSEKSKATAADMTRIFGMGENTGGMELTSCVRGLVPTNQGKTPISDKSKTPDVEATRVFGNGEDTGRMELTSCVGGLVPPKQGKTPMSCRSETPAVETTRVFGLGEDTGRMELPSCVGGLLLTNQGKIPMSDRSKAPAVETTVFGMGEDTGRMELTSCVGGLVPTNQGKAPMNRKTPAAEMTRVFGIGDDTGRMELTSCAEGVLQQHNESSPAGVEIKDSAPEITRILGNEIGKMELTSCIENNLLKSKVVEMEREAPASEIQDRESGKVGLTSDIGNVLENSDITSSHAKMADLINRSNISHIADIGNSILETEMTNGNSSKAIQYPSACTANQSMSVLVTENMAGFGHSEVSFVEDDIIGTDDKDRSAGTFTIKGEDADTFTITGEAESCQQDKCPQEGVPGSKRKQEEMDCLESLSQSKLIKTDSHDTGLVHEGEEESMKGILEELPPDEIEELENLDLTAATTFHENDVSKHQPSGSSDEEACHKSILSKSLQDRTEIDNFSFLDTAKSAGREITVGEFLGNFLIANLTSLPPATNDRRSLMPLLQRSEPNDLAGCLSASCIDVPKCQMYEWAVEYVSQNIEKMEHSVLELTETLHHKEEMKKKMIIGSAEMKGLEKRVQKLHQVCRKGTKTSWKEWKSKMLSSILTSVTERHDHLKKTVESISESVTQMDNDMQELEQYEADLDTAINELESLELPDEQQQQLYTEQHGKICRLGRELEGMRENQAALQKEKELLVIEEERVQSDLIDLEEMRNKREKVDSVAENLQTAYNKCKRLERLSEGKLKEWDDAGCAVAFLYDSLWLRVTYGGAVPSDLKERVVSSVNFESYLESSSAASAHLSHVMVREAVDCEGLLQKYPTTNSLPKMLEELSYVVSHARCFEWDIRHVQFWHPVEIHDKKVKVEFSNFRAFAKFSVTFELVPGSYPRAPVKFIFTNKIGDVSEDDVNSVLANVQPGYCYFKRLVQAVDDFIEKRSINSDDSDTS